MLDQHPVLKDRLAALGVFSGIALGAAAGFNLVITGGFDFLTPGDPIHAVAPSSYVQVTSAPWREQGRVIPLSSHEPMFAGDSASLDASYANEDADGDGLLGDARERAIQAQHERRLADIQADIDALYQDEAPLPDARIYASPEAAVYRAEPEFKEKPADATYDGVSASETASPW